MASEVSICNRALSHLGIGRGIASLDERSAEAQACRDFYELMRDATLRDVPWPFASRYVTLALVEDLPVPEWLYSYREPANCLAFREIPNGIRPTTRVARIPYEILSDDDGGLIYTNRPLARGKYTAKVTDTNRFKPDFDHALSLRLAAAVAPRLTAGDPNKLGARAMQLYDYEIKKAMAAAMNEEQPEEAADSEFINARN